MGPEMRYYTAATRRAQGMEPEEDGGATTAGCLGGEYEEESGCWLTVVPFFFLEVCLRLCMLNGGI